MKRLKAKDLEFISRIKRDGSGTEPVDPKHVEWLKNGELTKDEYFNILCLSMSEGTSIAHGFNSYIVKVKKK